MKNRPYGFQGRLISSIAVLLDDPQPSASREDWHNRIRALINQGVTGFEVLNASRVLAGGLGDALAGLDRSRFVVAWRLQAGERTSISRLDIADAVDQFLQWTGLRQLDILMLDWETYRKLEPSAWQVLDALGRAGAVERLGIAGDERAVDLCLSDPRFTAVKTYIDVVENDVLRRKITEAGKNDIVVLARAFFESLSEDEAPRTFLAELAEFLGFRKSSRKVLAPALEFLHRTPDWAADELTLACMLVDPSITAGVVEVLDDQVMARLARSTERELPHGAAVSLELARVAGAKMDNRMSGRG